MGDEGSAFFLTWTHQSGRKQRVDRCVKGALLGQLGNFRRQFKRLHKASQKGRTNMQPSAFMYKAKVSLNMRLLLITTRSNLAMHWCQCSTKES